MSFSFYYIRIQHFLILKANGVEHLINRKTKAVFLGLWIVVSISLSSTAQTIHLNSSFSADTVIYPFGTSDTVYGLTISGSCMLNSDTSLVRVILQNSDYEELLIFEAYPLITDGYDSSFSNIGDETRILESTIPLSVRVEIVDASIDILELSENRVLTENADSLRLLIMEELELKKISNLNREIARRGMKWVAGGNDITMMSYSEKKKLFGEKYNFNGFDYYAGGIFDFTYGNLTQISVLDLISDFDWRNRHGANSDLLPNSPYYGGFTGWMTPVGSQKCNHCWIYAPVHATEALVNLFFNQQLNVDLSEQAVASCKTPNDNCSGGWADNSFEYIKSPGIIDENCFPYNEENPAGNNNPCPASFTNITDQIKISNYSFDFTQSEEEIKRRIINKGPVVVLIQCWWHYIVFCGFGNVKYLDYIYVSPSNQNDNIQITDPEDPLIGQNYWIVKNSWAESWGENGFGKIIFPLQQFQEKMNIETPIISIERPLTIECIDFDKDGYFNWGISEQKPTNCPECTNEKDSDDSNPRLGPFDENYFSVPVAPVMVLKQGSYTIHQNGFYSFYNEAWPIGHEEVLTFTIINTGTAQLNLMPNSFGGTVTLSDNNQSDFSVESVLLNTTIPMEDESTSFDIRFRLNAPINESKMITVTIHLDEEDLEDFVFTLVFTECTDNIAIEPIQVSTPWDVTMIKLGDVVVETGATLTITGNVAFSQQANLFVEQGGTVIIDGGHLTSLCNSKWKGVDVWGDITKSQFNSPPEVRQEQGIIKIINGGKISYAENAIETIRYVDDKPDLATSGGIVSIKDGSIENCTNGVVFYPYENFYPDKNSPQSNWSRFYQAHFVNDQVYPEAQIYFNGVAGIMIQGSDFENKLPVSTLQNATRAINSYNSGFSVSQIELPPNSGGSFIQSTFKGFDQGIYALSGRMAEYLSIRSSIFEDNKRSIYLSSIETSVITQNKFMVRDNYSKYDDDTPLVGLYLDNQSSNFTIEENRFYSNLPYASLQSRKCLGVVVNSSGQHPNELYNNNFDYLTIGIEAIGENRDAVGAGLCIKCNDFADCVTDIYVAPDENPSNYQGIALKQGEVAPEPPPGTDPDPTISAGNTFSVKYDNTINYFNEEDCYPIIYTFHGNNNTPFKIEPYPIYPPLPSTHINLSPDTYVTFDSKNDACPSSIGGSINTTLEKGELENEIIIAESYVDTLNMLVDGGDTESLNWDVQMSFPGEALEVRQLLLNESPYLSDTVLKSAIDKENVLPNAMIRDVLTANPQSAKSPAVLQTINARINPMPENMMDEIMQGATVFGPKELIEQRLALHKTKRDRSLTKLLRHYRSDTLNQAASNDSIIVLLQNQLHPEPHYELAMLYLNRNDSINAFNTLDYINTNFDLTQKQMVVHELYADLLEILWEMKKTNVLLPDSLQINELLDIASYLKTKPGTYALNMLIRSGELLYEEPVYFPPTFKAKPIWNLNGKKESKKPSFLKIFPNPAASYFTAEYLLQGEVAQACVTLTDIEGNELKKIDLSDKQSQIIVPTNGCSEGTYVLKLIGNGKVIESKKVIITN